MIMNLMKKLIEPELTKQNISEMKWWHMYYLALFRISNNILGGLRFFFSFTNHLKCNQ